MNPRGRRWFLALLLGTAAVSAALLLLPLSAEQSTGRAARSRTLLAGEGPAVILPLAVPVLVCAVPVLAPARRRRAAALASAAFLAAGALLSVASVGLFYVPSAVLLAVGAGRRKA